MPAGGDSRSLFVVQRAFRRVRRGYDPEEVDRHLQLVSEWFASGRGGRTALGAFAIADELHCLVQRGFVFLLLVDVGTGEKAADYDGRDVRGKVVLASGNVGTVT